MDDYQAPFSQTFCSKEVATNQRANSRSKGRTRPLMRQQVCSNKDASDLSDWSDSVRFVGFAGLLDLSDMTDLSISAI